MIRTWLLPASALVIVAGVAVGLRSTEEVPVAMAIAERQERPPEQRSVDRIYLTPAQQAEARRSGTWLHDVQSLLRVERPLRYGQFIWNDAGSVAGPVWVRVDLRTQVMSVFRGAHEIGTTVVLYGADGKETPKGTFPILWRKRDHVSSLYDAPMPYTLRLTGDGIAIHGSDVRWGAATHGCVGVPKEFAAHLFEVTKVGDRVAIVRTPPPRTA